VIGQDFHGQRDQLVVGLGIRLPYDALPLRADDPMDPVPTAADQRSPVRDGASTSSR
jgi:hypothetical protein